MTVPPPAAPSDTELLRQVAQGDREAFGQFYDRLSRPLYATALRMLREPAEAQDVIHDAFVAIWENASSFDPSKGSAFSWAVTLVRNRCLDRIRRSRRRAELLAASAPADLYPAEPARAADDHAALDDERAAVQAALAELGPDQKQAVELAFFSGLTQEEIARSLNQPLGTVKARIRRGLLKLRDLLVPRP